MRKDDWRWLAGGLVAVVLGFMVTGAVFLVVASIVVSAMRGD